MKKALVCGAGGFIGHHLVNSLKSEGFWVRGIDLKRNPFGKSHADEFIIGDLTDPHVANEVLNEGFDEVYQLAADMGGAGYIFTGDNDAAVMHNSALCNLNVLEASRKNRVKKVFYSSSACIYPEYNQTDPENPNCAEDSVYPAMPDSEYGWEKLFSERLYLNYAKNYGMEVRIARFHNVFGTLGAWNDGKEKAPAALCRKVAEAENGGQIEIWGDGLQTRSFLYIDECLEGVRRFMDADFQGPLNIGSDEMISINDLARMITKISGKQLSIRNVSGPLGVRGRNSDNRLIGEKLTWRPSLPLEYGMTQMYEWIYSMISKEKKNGQSSRDHSIKSLES